MKKYDKIIKIYEINLCFTIYKLYKFDKMINDIDKFRQKIVYKIYKLI